VSQESTNRSFDDLARAVAEGSLSRRRALKLFAGTAIAALIPSRALADDDECVRVCHVPFNRETEEECDFANARTRCVSRRERRRHLENHPCDCRGRCANCLCLPNGGTCMANDDCCSGNCSNGFCCESARVGLSNGTCVRPCGADCNAGPCGSNPCGCWCERNFCGNLTPTGQENPCSNDMDCPAGSFCSFGFCRSTSC
jgi:hypothetical protein